jgi:ribosome biogenesis protein MAK21
MFIGRSKEQSHIFYSVAYLNRIAQMVAPKDDKVRLMLLRIYFSLFRKVLKNDEESKAELVVKKDRTKSKQQNKQAAKVKKANFKPDELDQEDNKVAELVLKGVNILVTKCSQQLFGNMSSGSDSSKEIARLIEEETNSLFRLSHHEVFRIAVQSLKLLFAFAKHSKRLQRTQQGDIDIAKEENQDGEGPSTLMDRYYRALYEQLLRVHLNKPGKLDEFFALIFKSVKSDGNSVRVLAFVRRII